MQSIPSRFYRPAPLGFAVALMASACLLAACDRHSAAELPESYGHGSSHQKSFTDHQPDSRNDSRSFSDTQGIETKEEGKSAPTERPAASPTSTAPGHFFPNGS